MTDPDNQLLAAVVNRMGQGELIHVLQNIFERLEALEKARAPKEEKSSSDSPKEPVHHQKQHQG